MALYTLRKMKYSRHEDDKLRIYGVGDTVELSDKEARRLKWGIEPASGGAQPSTTSPTSGPGTQTTDQFGALTPDEMDEIRDKMSGTADEAESYLRSNKEDSELLAAARTIEMQGKRRKGVLSVIDELEKENAEG